MGKIGAPKDSQVGIKSLGDVLCFDPIFCGEISQVIFTANPAS